MAGEEIEQISIRTVDQGDDQSGEWIVQRRVTASTFGEIVRRRAAYAPLVERLLYNKTRQTKAMQYGHDNEPKARDLYCDYQVLPSTGICRKNGFPYRSPGIKMHM